MTLCHTTDVVRQKSAEWLLDLSFGHMMACRLFCTEPLYEPLLINWTLRNKCYITFICIWTVLFCYQLMITDTTYHRHVADNTIILPCEVMQHNRNAIHISVQNNENNKRYVLWIPKTWCIWWININMGYQLASVTHWDWVMHICVSALVHHWLR